MAMREESRRPFPAAGAVDSYLVVSLSNGKIDACASNAKPLGATTSPAREAGDLIAVRLLNTDGTMEIQATGAVTAGADVVLAGAGKIKADPGNGVRTLIGMALTAVSDGGVVEVIPYGYNHNLS